MLIDKAKFVALVGAIAASTACLIVDKTDGDDDDGGDGSGDTTSAGSTSATTTSTTTTSASSSDATTDASSSSGGTACLADEGVAGACTGECEGFTTCDALPALKAGVAADVVPCLNALDPAVCSIYLDARATCLFDSLAKACDDIESVPLCTEIATACAYTDDATWQASCAGRLNGLTVEARGPIVSCTKEACGVGGTLDDCMNNLFFPQ